eukprot:g13168.t1
MRGITREGWALCVIDSAKFPEWEGVRGWDNTRRYILPTGEPVRTEYTYEYDVHSHNGCNEIKLAGDQQWIGMPTPAPLAIPTTPNNEPRVKQAIQDQETQLAELKQALDRHSRVLYVSVQNESVVGATQRVNKQLSYLRLLQTQEYQKWLEKRREKRAEAEKKATAIEERAKITDAQKESLNKHIESLRGLVKKYGNERSYDWSAAGVVEELAKWYATDRYDDWIASRLAAFLAFRWAKDATGLGTSGFTSLGTTRERIASFVEALVAILEGIGKYRPWLMPRWEEAVLSAKKLADLDADAHAKAEKERTNITKMLSRSWIKR